MPLSARDFRLFAKLYRHLMEFADEKLDLRPGDKTQRPDDDTMIAIRDALFEDRQLIDAFVTDNPCQFSPEELEIVASWKHTRVGYFYIVRSLKEYAIFLGSTDRGQPSGELFRVVGLTDPFHEIVKSPLPALVRTALVPFRGKITFDGIMPFYEVDLGDTVRENLDWIYKYRKAKLGIVTSLVPEDEPLPRRKAEKPIKQRKRNRRQLEDTVAKKRARQRAKNPKR